MTSMHWEEHNYFAHYGHHGLQMLGFRPNREPPQVGFFFDDRAAEWTREALMGDLPEVLHRHSDGVVIDDLYSQLANQMPASTTQLRDALLALRDQGEVDILGPKRGAKRSRGVCVNDRVRPRKQLILPVTVGRAHGVPTGRDG
jgi:hypothetical protein